MDCSSTCATLCSLEKATKWSSCGVSSGPNFSECAIEVLPHHFFGHVLGVTPLLQFGGDDLHAIRYVQVGRVGWPIFFGRGDSQLFSVGHIVGELLALFWSIAKGVDHAIAPDADVLGPTDFQRVIEMRDYVFPCGRYGARHQVGHEIDPDNSAAVGKCFQF